jgi:selenocysteine lyase/cysteine desulfurase
VITGLEDSGHEVVLYAVSPELEVDCEDLARKVRPNDIFLYVRYFGIGHSPAATEVARRAGALVLEDTSQAPFHYDDAAALRPDWAFTSLRKYLPLLDGAALDTLKPELATRTPVPGGRPPLRLLLARAAALRLNGLHVRKPRRVYAALAQEMFAAAACELRRSPVEAGMSRWSRRLLAQVDLGAVVERRRANYAALVAGLDEVAGIRVLWPRLPVGVCPYGCPIIVPNNRLWRDALYRRGVQGAILWDREDHWAQFPASRWLAEHLFVLPVSQTYTEEDMQRTAVVLSEYGGGG